MDWPAVLGAALTAIASLVGVLYSNRATRKLVMYRVDQLEKKVEIHNTFDRRMVAIETKLGMISGGK